MNYKAALFVMVEIAFLMSGCKAYSGYRNFTENVEIETKNDENVLESDYEIKVFDKRLYAVQNKKVVYTQKMPIAQISPEKGVRKILLYFLNNSEIIIIFRLPAEGI